MANFYRVMWFFLGFLLSAVPMLAFAQEKETYPQAFGCGGPNGLWCFGSPPIVNVTYASASDACSVNGTIDRTVGEEISFKKYKCITSNGTWNGTVQQIGYCPTGGAKVVQDGEYLCLNGNACLEGETRNPETSQCEAPPPPDCGSKGSWSEAAQTCVCQNGYKKNAAGKCEDSECPDFVGTTGWYGTTNASSACSMGCALSRSAFSGSACRESSHDPITGQPSSWQCQMGYTGQNCGPYGSGDGNEPRPPELDENTPGPGEKESCPEGMYSGTVNGKKVCIAAPPPTDKKDNKEKTTTNPDGSTTTEKTETHITVNNNTVTTTTTTTTTNKNSSGEVTGTDIKQESSTQSKSGYCEVNKNSLLCQGEGGGGFGGNCDEKPSCEGDPLACAIAKHTFETKCALIASDEVMDAFEAMKGFSGTGEGEGLDRKEINVEDEFDVTEIGGGSGLEDFEVWVLGFKITIPFSWLNRFIEMFGYAMMMIAWIRAYQIIAGAM